MYRFKCNVHSLFSSSDKMQQKFISEQGLEVFKVDCFICKMIRILYNSLIYTKLSIMWTHFEYFPSKAGDVVLHWYPFQILLALCNIIAYGRYNYWYLRIYVGICASYYMYLCILVFVELALYFTLF